MDLASHAISIIREDPVRWHLLGLVRDLQLPDCWIGAGFVRNAIWDRLHDRPCSRPASDVDVIWYARDRADPAEDRACEALLRASAPSIAWSVKNQARMHVRNDDQPYDCATDAMRHWPETATAVAVRRHGPDGCDVAAPYGLDDLFGLVLRPTPRFWHDKRGIYDDRASAKRWTDTWPLLRTVASPDGGAARTHV